jgi:hypothetical protein
MDIDPDEKPLTCEIQTVIFIHGGSLPFRVYGSS